jgi:hypothetical protein
MPLFGEKRDFVLKIANFSGVDVTTLVGLLSTNLSDRLLPDQL